MFFFLHGNLCWEMAYHIQYPIEMKNRMPWLILPGQSDRRGAFLPPTIPGPIPRPCPPLSGPFLLRMRELQKNVHQNHWNQCPVIS